MSVFQTYSQFYDSLYQSKDYLAEVKFIRSVIKKFSPIKVKKVLSLGCGTCNHDILMAKKGYQIAGLDQSATMLSRAQQKIKSEGLSNKISLHQGDVRYSNMKDKFDFAMAMFNVIGYQITNDDINATLKNVSSNLKPGGLFLFDCWYAPAVLADPPTDRVKEIKKSKSRIIRLTQSILQHEKNIVQIQFHVFSLVGKKITSESAETHHMRYWTLPELSNLLEINNLQLVNACPFLKIDSEVSPSEWDIFIVAQKKK